VASRIAGYRVSSGTHHGWAAHVVSGLCGHLRPSQLNARVVRAINGKIDESENHFTRKNRANAVRWLLRKLEDCGAPSLTNEVVKVTQPRPRNVTATEDERNRILKASPPHLRCWLLMCSDMAIRSGTAAKLGPEHYDAARRELTFTTKYQARQRLPVTGELAALLDTCTKPGVPFVGQLPRAAALHRQPLHALEHMTVNSLRKLFAATRRRLGIKRKLTAHDLRRTTAVRVYDATRDIRLVQALLGHGDLGSTIWYLDHHMTPVPSSALELAKLNPTTEKLQ
jgi:integrase